MPPKASSHGIAIFWSAKKRRKYTFISTLRHLSPVIFATATVVAFVLLRSLGSTFIVVHSVKQRLLRNRRLLARKITKGIHSCKPASLKLPVDNSKGDGKTGRKVVRQEWKTRRGSEGSFSDKLHQQPRELISARKLPRVQQFCNTMLIFF